jgi:PHD/YefM family antitoxin component YafN of YafNO toxin-antitoxin module
LFNFERKKDMTTNLNFKYQLDEKGEPNAVIIPLRDWQIIQKQIEDFEFITEIRQGVRDSMQEIAEIKAGKRKKPQTLKEFLNEC